MDLQTMKTQMNTVIQKHQIVVNEMRNDPQNPILQKRLHELQLEIASLNARQQQIFNEVRKKIGHSSPDSTSTTNTSVFPACTTSPTPQTSNHDIRMVCCTQKCPMANHKMQTTTMVSKPVANCVNTVRQTVPPSLNNISTPTATITFKGPVGTVVLPNCSTTNALLSNKAATDHSKMHPVLVVPSPSNRNVDGPQTGVLLNLVPPIRVPQYPPPSSPRAPVPLACQKMHMASSSIPSTTSSPSTLCNSGMFVQTSGNTSTCCSEKSSPVDPPDKTINKIDQKKKEFFAALGLVTRDSLSDIKSKKLERKRRSTANPQFSNAALEEKWKNAAAAAQVAGPSQKRPRGRPRLETKPIVCPTNGICEALDSPKMDPLSPTDSNATLNSASQSSSSPPNDSPTLVNGVHRQTSSDEAKNVEQMLSGLCIVCTQPGDLVKCDTCAKQQHLSCMQPPLISKPQAPWMCCECQSTRTVSLTAVQSYEFLKAAKDDEKRKLLKKSLELRYKRSQLESRLIHLKELSGKQKNRQSELQSSLKSVELLTDRIHSVINTVKLCS